MGIAERLTNIGYMRKETSVSLPTVEITPKLENHFVLYQNGHNPDKVIIPSPLTVEDIPEEYGLIEASKPETPDTSKPVEVFKMINFVSTGNGMILTLNYNRHPFDCPKKRGNVVDELLESTTAEGPIVGPMTVFVTKLLNIFP